MAVIAVALAATFTGATFASTADARSYRMTIKRMKQIGAQAANEKEDEFTAEDGSTIVDWEGTCRVTGRTTGACDIDYEFDDGAVCSDTIRAKLNPRTNRATYWSDSDREDDGGNDDGFSECTGPSDE